MRQGPHQCVTRHRGGSNRSRAKKLGVIEINPKKLRRLKVWQHGNCGQNQWNQMLGSKPAAARGQGLIQHIDHISENQRFAPIRPQEKLST